MNIFFLLEQLKNKKYSTDINLYELICNLSNRYGFKNKKYDKSVFKNEEFQFNLYSTKIPPLLLKADFLNINIKIQKNIRPFYFKKFLHNFLNYPHILPRKTCVYLFKIPYNKFLLNNKTILELTSLTNIVLPNFFKYKNNNLETINSLSKINHIIVHTEEMKNDLISKLFCKEDKISVIPRGINNSFFNKKHIAKEITENKYKLPKKYFLFAGKISRYKNLERLITAFTELQLQDTELVIAGDYNTDYESYAHAYAYYKLILNLSKKHKNIKLLGYVDRVDMPIVMANAKALIEPSFYNNFPDTILESYASSTPVIASNISIHKRYVKNQNFLFSPYSIKEMKSSMIKILEEKPQTYDFVNDYTWDKVILKVYNANKKYK